jgi:putative transposase/transposase-like zinc-binding protein
VDFAEVLREHWPRYVKEASGPIPSRAWAAVEAVLSCRTARRGGHLYHCAECRRPHYVYHSCNHRACPRCGAREQAEWARRQQARLLPVPYYLLTLTVPEEMRGVFLHFPQELYPAFFAAVSDALKALCARSKFLGGNIGFIAILHTWTRRMLFHPHIHVLVPAVGLAPSGCELKHPRNEEYFLPEKALAQATRKAINEALTKDHPEILARIEPAAWQKPWVVQVQGAGRGRTALRYLAAYVKKSAFSEGRLLGYEPSGRIVLSYRNSADGKLKSEALDPLELIRRWLLHVLPEGLVRVRHYGWLSPAAHMAFLRVRFLLGLGPSRIPPLCKSEAPRCPFCNGPLSQIARIAPQRGPPLSQAILKAPA